MTTVWTACGQFLVEAKIASVAVTLKLALESTVLLCKYYRIIVARRLNNGTVMLTIPLHRVPILRMGV
jgi:hypothetical protein